MRVDHRRRASRTAEQREVCSLCNGATESGEFAPKNCRYDDQIAIFGADVPRNNQNPKTKRAAQSKPQIEMCGTIDVHLKNVW